MESGIVECPMCGRLHRILQTPYRDVPNVDNPDLLQAGRNAAETAQQAARIAPQVVNRGLEFAGFTENGVVKGSIASGLQSKAGNVSKGSLFSSAQSFGAKASKDESKQWVAAIAALTVVVANGAKFAWDTYQAHRANADAEREQREQERRAELNLCENCWQVVQLSENN